MIYLAKGGVALQQACTMLLYCELSLSAPDNIFSCFKALDRLGFSDYTVEAEAVLKDCKAVAAKRRRQSTRLENLGIPEEELLRQQQELFAKVSSNLFITMKFDYCVRSRC